MTEPLSIIFLWHMHQPYYRDPGKGEYVLPWTYLHGVKDYFDMAAIVDETPGARVVFNLVPSLLDQLLEYAAGTASDRFLLLGSMEPADLREEDRLFLLENFFSANHQRMIDPYPRYRELLTMAGGGAREKIVEQVRQFRAQDLLDLQVWFFLAWTGEAARRRYPEIGDLIRKGRNFSAGDRDRLLALHREILREIIPLYGRLAREGKAELAVSPYYHPILPLLCDTRIAQIAMPRATLPTHRLVCPEDARTQVVGAVERCREILGIEPKGMWPSEGSVSDAALGIIAAAGLSWAASDEDVLAKSLPGGLGPGRRELYRPHTFEAEGERLALFFRDHALSDLIGFTYSQWEPERAVADFVGRLAAIRDDIPGARVVPVILDGENAWEYYADNGYPFLSLLYREIANHPRFRLATCSEALKFAPERPDLRHIHPGSWINADYGIWIGHPEENRAWNCLARAREAAVDHDPLVARLLASGVADSVADDTARQVCAALYAAEGSDWFWWYGDDHYSPHSDRFDELFRRHLQQVYRLLGIDIPRDLYEPIKRKSPAGFVREPAGLITPEINGQVNDYFEWLAAGLFDLTRQSSAMHAAESLFQAFYYGYDRHEFYVRIDGFAHLDRVIHEEDRLVLQLASDREFRLVMDRDGTGGCLQEKETGGWRETDSQCRWRIDRVCEVAIPLDFLAPEPGGRIFAVLILLRDGQEIGRWPVDAAMPLVYAGPELELENWLI